MGFFLACSRRSDSEERCKLKRRRLETEINLQNLIFKREEREISVDQIVDLFLTHKAAHCFTQCKLD